MISQLCVIFAAAAVATSLESTTADPLCVDHDLYCGILFKSHFCKDYKVVQMQCPKSCNMCGHQQASTTTISTQSTTASSKTTYTTTTPIPFSSTTHTTPTGCFDIDPDCFSLLKTHYCTEELAKKMCAATCNICVKPTTTELYTSQTMTDATSTATTAETTASLTTELETTTEPTVYESTTDEQTTENQEMTSPESTPTSSTTNDYNATEEITSPNTSSSSTTSMTATTVNVQTSPATLPSLKPFIPSVNNCFDKDDGCKFLVDSPFCDQDPLVPRVCPVACGVCVNTTGSPTITPEPCVDLDPTCEELQNISHLCEEFGLVRKQCPKSCHVCSQSVSTTPQTSTCMDYDPNCSSLKPFCAAKVFVRKLCPKTCDVCQAATDLTTASISPTSSSISSSASLTPSTTIKLSCRTCEDPLCDMGIEADHTCPVHAPYCMNIVGRDTHNIPTLTKRCASEIQCEERWLKQSALDTRCLNLNSSQGGPFLCTFCCVTHECNIPPIPRPETLYRGRFR